MQEKEEVLRDVEWRKENLIKKEFEEAVARAEECRLREALSKVEFAGFWRSEVDGLLVRSAKRGLITSEDKKRIREELRDHSLGYRRKIESILEEKCKCRFEKG